MGNKQLSNLHVRSGAHPARDRDRVDSKSPQADWLPDGVGRHSIPRAKFGGRNRGLLGHLVSRGPLDRRLTPYACVEHLASHRRLADEGAGPRWLKVVHGNLVLIDLWSAIASIHCIAEKGCSRKSSFRQRGFPGILMLSVFWEVLYPHHPIAGPQNQLSYSWYQPSWSV